LTAERLYAENGIDAVSMREIARAANQKNNSALLYHFGSKEALINAILDHRMKEIDALRNGYMDEADVQNRTDLRAAVEALVMPLAQGLVEAQTHNYYNRFLAAAQNHPELDLAAQGREDLLRGFRRVYAMLDRTLPQIPPALLRQRYLTSVALITFSLADFERIQVRRVRQSRLFDMSRAVENLIDMVAGALAAPISDQVRRRMKIPGDSHVS
jgi:AcrR family transcriptional regulator